MPIDENRVEGEVVVDDTPPLKSPLVAVGDPNATPVKKADDSGNRLARVGVNSGAWTAIAYFIQKYTSVDAEDVMLAIPLVVAATAWIVSQLEYRGYIKSMKNKDAEIAPAVTLDGTRLGQAR